MPPPAKAPFEDRTVTLEGAPTQLARDAAVLASETRLAVLRTLLHSDVPLNINEVARRVGVDPSPARGHLESLAKAGLADEVGGAPARERRFTTRLRDVRLVFEGYHRAARPVPRAGPAPKAAARLEKKLGSVRKALAKQEEKARRLEAELEKAWSQDAA